MFSVTLRKMTLRGHRAMTEEVGGEGRGMNAEYSFLELPMLRNINIHKD